MKSRTQLKLLGVFALLCPTSPAFAGPGEPLVTERLADPDPGYVPPPPVKQYASPKRNEEGDSSLDRAFENIGRITGQAAKLAEQHARAQSQDLRRIACNSVESARSSGIDVSAWDKDCPH